MTPNKFQSNQVFSSLFQLVSGLHQHMGLGASNLSWEVCKQYRRRPACAYAQSDQHLCYSRFDKYHMAMTRQNLSLVFPTQ